MALTASDITKKVKETLGFKTGFVGVDIGSSSIKIVQLSLEGGAPVLETYGEIVNPISLDKKRGAIFDNASAQGGAVADILHEVDARSRICGVGIPLSETLINKVDLPKRDPEQMAKIVPVEAKKYIPALEKHVNVMMDWYVLPDGSEEEGSSVFDALKPQQKTLAQFQKVMIVAVNEEVSHALGDIVSESNLQPQFYEIEMFAAIRACAHDQKSASLVLDFGASSTKAYIVSKERLIVAGHMIPLGGRAITEALMNTLRADYLSSERAKCEQGFTPGTITSATVSSMFNSVWTYLEKIVAQHKEDGISVERVIAIGGGAYMPGLLDTIREKIGIPATLGNGFVRTRGPMILENTLKEDGPRYAVAAGLALRGIGKS